MNGTEKQEMSKVENYDYENDFQLLPLKKKRRILRIAKDLYDLQKKNDDLYSQSTEGGTEALC